MAIAGHACSWAGVGASNARREPVADSRSEVLKSEACLQRSSPESATSHSRAASSRARANTSSIIGSVSLPVNVFCWLGW